MLMRPAPAPHVGRASPARHAPNATLAGQRPATCQESMSRRPRAAVVICACRRPSAWTTNPARCSPASQIGQPYLTIQVPSPRAICKATSRHKPTAGRVKAPSPPALSHDAKRQHRHLPHQRQRHQHMKQGRGPKIAGRGAAPACAAIPSRAPIAHRPGPPSPGPFAAANRHGRSRARLAARATAAK